MNDKQQLAAMGEHMTEQPMCMAKRIEELESKYKAAMEVVRDLVELPYSTGGLMERLEVRERARDLLAGQLPAPVVPEGWQLVPVNPTSEMISAGNAALAYDCCSGTADEAWPAMLSAAPKPEVK
ncbi:MAG: hypothetical protein ACRCXB_29180 [Aeromonadaceae bacterium]